MRHFAIWFLFALNFAAPLQADSRMNAEFVVQEHLRSMGVNEHAAALHERAVASIEEALRKFDVEILDRERFQDVWIGDYFDLMLDRIVSQSAEILADEISPADLSSLASFYRSAAGQTFVEMGRSVDPNSWATREFMEGPGQPLIEATPKLMEQVSLMFDREMILMADELSTDRLADIAEMDGILGFQDEAHRRRVIIDLRTTH